MDGGVVVVLGHGGSGHREYLTDEQFQQRYCVPSPPSRTVRLLAQPYADRPGYREEWKP